MRDQVLANKIGTLVNRYFYDRGHGMCEPRISYNQYDIKKYTFRMSCQTYHCTADYCTNNQIELENFRKEVRVLLREAGYKKVKFDTERLTITGGAFGDYKVIRLNAIYFDI